MLFPGAPRKVEVAGATVREVIAGLDELWPGMAARLCDERPALRRHITVFVAGERTDLHGVVPPGAEVHVVPAVSGG
ncbi:MAG: MoaD/ThiS family protein [Dehalococcoidia bacterium]|nr:MoaD/ThiS family protein [Dehalococcoidia bacterium]